MMNPTDITGLVLAGGLGRRMSRDGRGANKALTLFRGQPMVSHVITRLAPQVGSLLLNVNQEPERFETFDLPIVSDEIGGFAGPLAGLHAGLTACTSPWLLTCPCDSPFLPLDLVARLANAVESSGRPLAYARTGTQTHPVFALVASHLRDDLARFLAGGGRKIDRWYTEHEAVTVDFEDEQAFRNINTPDDLTRFEPEQENPAR